MNDLPLKLNNKIRQPKKKKGKKKTHRFDSADTRSHTRRYRQSQKLTLDKDRDRRRRDNQDNNF